MPDWSAEIKARLSGVPLDAARESEIIEELSQHLDQRFRELVAVGTSEEEARSTALAEIGESTSLSDGLRRAALPSPGETARFQATPGSGLANLWQDLRYGFRLLRKSPGFTAVATLTLALGIGVNTTMFSVLQANLLRPLPYAESERLLRVFRTSPQSRSWPHSVPNFLDYQGQNQVFEAMAAFNQTGVSFVTPGEPAERLRGFESTANLFSVLGIRPEFGRVFTEEEGKPGGNRVVLLGHGFWMRRFAGDSNILGRTLRLDGELATVIGVLPAGCNDPRLAGRIDIWRPLHFSKSQRENRGFNWLQSLARLKPGISLAQAQAEMNVLSARLAAAYPGTNTGEGLRLVTMVNSGNSHRWSIVALTMGLAGFVLLIACANLANLQFARTAARARELAIRSALGAPRGRLVRQLFTESLLIAGLGGLLGLALAHWGNELMEVLIQEGDVSQRTFRLNLRGLGLAFAASAFTGLVFGLVPAWLASRHSLGEVLKQGSRGSTHGGSTHPLRHALIVVEIALALTLLAGAGLLVRGLQRFTARDPGWQLQGLTLAWINLPDSRYKGEGPRYAFTERLRAKLATLPGIERMAAASSAPIRAFGTAANFSVEGQPEPPPGQSPLGFINFVTPGYFETLGMKLLAGRDFTTYDTTNHPAVVIINQAMAHTFWPGQSPIGRRIGGPNDWKEVVGVVSDAVFAADLNPPETRFQTYRPLAQEPPGGFVLLLRGRVSSDQVRRAIAELDPELPVDEPGSARAAVEQAISGATATGWLLSGFAGLGLLMAALGIYGVISGFVIERTGEIGLRLALGAQLRDVLWLVVGKGLRLTLLGTAIGLAGALGVVKLLLAISSELKTNDPLTLLGVAGLLTTVALLACWLPARRAARVDPLVALRTE